MNTVGTSFFATHYDDTDAPFGLRAEEFFADVGLKDILFDGDDYGDELDDWTQLYLEALVELLDEHIADNDDIYDALMDLRNMRSRADTERLDDDSRFLISQSRHCLSADVLGEEVYDGLYAFFSYIRNSERIADYEVRESLERRGREGDSQFLRTALSSPSCSLVEVSKILHSAADCEDELSIHLGAKMPLGEETIDRLAVLNQSFRQEYLRIAAEKIQLLNEHDVPVYAAVVAELISGEVEALSEEMMTKAELAGEEIRHHHYAQRRKAQQRRKEAGEL